MTRPHPNPNPERSLFEEMGEIADEMRQIETDLGARPYRVFAVVLEWTGKEKGRGDPVVVRETELLPTPLVRLRGVRTTAGSGGKAEKGYTEITEISPRYTEDELQWSFHVKQPSEGVEVFYEVRQDARDGRQPVRRRFVLRSPPERNVEEHEWILRLSVQDERRSRTGEPNKAGRVWQK